MTVHGGVSGHMTMKKNVRNQQGGTPFSNMHTIYPRCLSQSWRWITYSYSSLEKYVFDHELKKHFLLFQHLPQGIFDLFVPQTVDERVQHGDHQ